MLYLASLLLINAQASEEKIYSLYTGLNPQSLEQHQAFLKLYPNHPKSSLIPSIHKKILNQTLKNRSLKGHTASSIKEILKLDPKDIDLSRALTLSLKGEFPQSALIKNESILDSMACEILLSLPKNPSPRQQIDAINRLIFKDLRFRFPPESFYSANIDLYTFLPSVLQSREGVCLGISTLYLCLAQRIGLSLEMITPPGHIYIRYQGEHETINIETTARGIHLPSETYLDINTRSLQKRHLKEVIGMTFFNQASTYWKAKKPKKAIKAYKNALLYMPNDPLTLELLAYQYLQDGQVGKGYQILKSIQNHTPDYLVSKTTLIDDYLNQEINIEGIKTIFKDSHKTRKSILHKQKELQLILKDYPNFQEGLFQLAITWLQLNRPKEALKALNLYHKINPNNPTVEYYLASLYCDRLNYPKAYLHLNKSQQLTSNRQHSPEVLIQLKRKLSQLSPK